MLARQSGKFIELISVIGVYFRSLSLSPTQFLYLVPILFSFSHLLSVEMSSEFRLPTSMATTDVFIVFSHNTIINMQAYGHANGCYARVPSKVEIGKPNINYVEWIRWGWDGVPMCATTQNNRMKVTNAIIYYSQRVNISVCGHKVLITADFRIYQLVTERMNSATSFRRPILSLNS